MKTFSKIISKFKAINTNFFVGGTALVVSICALFISIQEVRIMRIQQRASMYPYLTVSKVYNGEGFGITLKNSGNGLAKINSYRVYANGTYFNNWEELLKTLAPDATGIDYSIIRTAGNIRNEMITPNEKVNLIFLQWTLETRELEKQFSDLEVKLCYSSLLDEHWIIEKYIPIELDSPCNADSTTEFGL
ncbi:hypothetical protein [Spongiivirga citrea]|uniref:Uncharacterized protein n=1 Tax=Spongiivirga citrea TaxID=1481457 RepID=A0A6M0CTY3_9FLAO|nr:hypothetical protein [Spongiivirga citrea]NER18967.1 hypothetical protein [Spongiivirga citrea]